MMFVHIFFFFFQAEDGIRDLIVTGVQTCALPISSGVHAAIARGRDFALLAHDDGGHVEIGRASCRKSVDLGGRRIIKKKKKTINKKDRKTIQRKTRERRKQTNSRPAK